MFQRGRKQVIVCQEKSISPKMFVDLAQSLGCWLNDSFGIDVTIRQPTMFSGLIQVNCSSGNLSDLFVSLDQGGKTNCSIVETTKETLFNITCLQIEGLAGRDLQVDLLLGDQGFVVGTFRLTLAPLPLNESTALEIEYEEEPGVINVRVKNCQRISPEKYLRVQCSTSNQTSGKNCSFPCPQLSPGSNASLILLRLSIPLVDRVSSSIPGDTRQFFYRTSNTPRPFTFIERFFLLKICPRRRISSSRKKTSELSESLSLVRRVSTIVCSSPVRRAITRVPIQSHFSLATSPKTRMSLGFPFLPSSEE